MRRQAPHHGYAFMLSCLFMFTAQCESDRVLEIAIELPIRTLIFAETSSLLGR